MGARPQSGPRLSTIAGIARRIDDLMLRRCWRGRGWTPRQANDPGSESDLAQAGAVYRKEFRKRFRRRRWRRRRDAGAMLKIIADWEAEHGELTTEEKADARRKLDLSV